MGPQTEKLIKIASDPIAGGAPTIQFSNSQNSPKLESELVNLLNCHNGFFAFESALRVFPAQTVPASFGLGDWNVGGLWKSAYLGLADQLVCFAEDIFANQFAIAGQAIVLFNVETGEMSQFSSSIEEWAEKILTDYDFATGYTFARDWQKMHGPLSGRQRLLPTLPFVVGGDYAISNMKAIDGDRVLRSFGGFASQIHNKPNGARVRLTLQA